jgi:hypothetical protein
MAMPAIGERRSYIRHSSHDRKSFRPFPGVRLLLNERKTLIGR